MYTVDIRNMHTGGHWLAVCETLEDAECVADKFRFLLTCKDSDDQFFTWDLINDLVTDWQEFNCHIVKRYGRRQNVQELRNGTKVMVVNQHQAIPVYDL